MGFRMAISARVWTAGKVLLLVGALATTFVVFAIAAARVAVRARDVTVPNLVGRTVAEATATASGLELQLSVEETRRPDSQVPAGHVLGQEPPAGTSSRRQRSLRVWLSSGPRIARAPNLVGESQRAAEIRVSITAQAATSGLPPGIVTRQSPAGGYQVHPGDAISIEVSR